MAGPVYSQELPNGWESYTDRPDILEIEAKENSFNDNWLAIKAAHFSFIAEILALYPTETEIYFLARDSEYLYDVARLVTQGTSDENRIHLINVSRANMRDPNLKGYLEENGISEENIRNGKKVLFVDTGFSGTIPRVIGDIFSSGARAMLKTHLVVSSNPTHPSSRVFLVHLNPSVNTVNPSTMHGTIVNYEHMTRYTDRSSRYLYANGRHLPLSQIGKVTDGSVSKELSLKLMQDIKSDWQVPENRSLFLAEVQLFRETISLLSSSSGEAKEALKNRLEKKRDSAQGQVLEALIRDALEALSKANFKTEVHLSELGLKIIPENPAAASKKNELIAKFPDWAGILEDPETKIPELFVQKNWQMIGNLMDANIDDEINGILAKYLFGIPATGIKKALQISMIEKGDPYVLETLARSKFSKPHATKMKDLIKLVIEKGDYRVMLSLARHAFCQPHVAELKELISFIIEQDKVDPLKSLAEYTFSQPRTVAMKDLILRMIEKGDSGVMKKLAIYTFSKPHTAEMADLVRLLIEKGDSTLLQDLAQYTFSQPHTVKMEDLIRILIEKGDAAVLKNLAGYTFSQPHTIHMKNLIRLMIEKGDPEVMQKLARYTFSKPHTVEMTDLIRLMIEKGDSGVLSSLAFDTFSEPHTSGMAWLKESLSISDPTERKKWLLEKLGPLAVEIATVDISSNLRIGDVVTIQNRKMKVIKKAGIGRRGVVFQVQALDNKAYYALKVAIDNRPGTLASLAQESSKSRQWQKLGIPHAKVLVQEKSFVLKVWIEGESGKDVFEKYNGGDTAYQSAVTSLSNLVRKIRELGGYVGDFRPANLIWNKKAWVIIDSGGVQSGLSSHDAQVKWQAADERGPKFERRWKMPLPISSGGFDCKSLFVF